MITLLVNRLKNTLFCFPKAMLAACLVFFCRTAHSQEIFNPQVLHAIHITTGQENWFDSLQLYYNQALNGAENRFLPVQLVVDGDTLPDVGLRFKGKYSNYGFPGEKKPFRLDFNEFVDTQEFQGLKKLNLHNLAGDPSFLREFMAYDLFRYMGIAAPRAAFTELYIDGIFWGCYEIAEEPDKTFLKHHFGTKGGNLFESVKTTALSWKGNDPAGYPELELKTDSTATAWNNLIGWLDLFNNYYSFDFQQQLAERFDMDGYMRLLAAEVLINNQDAYWSNGRNFFLYDHPKTGKLHWIPWDYNLSFWQANHSPIPVYANQSYQPLIYRIYENPYLRKKYLTQFCKLIESTFAEYPFDARSQELYVLIRPAVEADTRKFYTTQQFYANRTQGVTVSMLRNNVPTDIYLPGLTDLYAKRRNELRKALFASGCDCDNLEESETLTGTVFPNPASAAPNGTVTIYIEDDLQGRPAQIAIVDINGKTVYAATENDHAGSFSCDVSALLQGVYFVQVTAGGKTLTTKLVK